MEAESADKMDPDTGPVNVNQGLFLVGVFLGAYSFFALNTSDYGLYVFGTLASLGSGFCLLAIIFNLLGEVGD